MALQTLLGFGAFIPFVPLKELLVGALAVYLGLSQFKKDKKPYLYLLFYGFVTLLFSDFTLEVLLNTEERLSLENEVIDYVELAKLVVFCVLLLHLALERIENKIRINILPVLSLVGLVTLSILNLSIYASLATLPLAIGLYINYFRLEEVAVETDKLHALKMWIVGITAMECIDLIAMLT